MPLEPGPHLDELLEAIAAEGRAHRALLAGDPAAAAPELRTAVERYRRSWELAAPASYGRLIGMVKAAVIAGEAAAAARYVRSQIPPEADSPPAAYARAIAALALGEPAEVSAMRAGSPPFGRTAVAMDALQAGDREAYAAAVAAIVADFEGREEHLTGVPIADTALMLERLAESRGLASAPASALLPARA